jgi:hypothetical protein
VSRDHEYKRHGTLSILASLDLHDGHVVARVEERHRVCCFGGLNWLRKDHAAAGETWLPLPDSKNRSLNQRLKKGLKTRIQDAAFLRSSPKLQRNG